MRNKIIFLSFLFLAPFLLSAQYKDLLKDKSISWIGEFEMDLSFDLQQEGYNINAVELTKYAQPKGLQKCTDGNCLVDFLFGHIVRGEVLCYRTASLERPYTIEEVHNLTSSTDTVITFYPETFEEVIQIIKNEINPDDIRSCRTRQILYYDKNSKSLNSRLIAYAPLVTLTDAEGNSIGKKPLLWVATEDIFGQNVRSENASVAWAANIYTRVTPLDFSKLKIVKGNVDFQKFLHETARDGDRPVKSVNNKAGKFLNKKDIKEIYSSVDTIITFDAQTYEETVQIVKEDRSYKDVNACRLEQEWFYIPEKRLLINRLKSVVPVTEVKDKNGNFKYWKPFYKIEYQ